MSATHNELLIALELHSHERIRSVLDSGLDGRAPIRGKLPVDWLTEMYTRSDRFPDCLRLLLERGAVLADPCLVSVLLNDATALAAAIRAQPALLEHRTNLISAFTPLLGASLLHVAAEFGHTQAARVLLDFGAPVDARAAVDDCGLNGHTPLFHTVNSNENRSAIVMRLLLEHGAQTGLHLAGITWGKGLEWETTCVDVTPISYAQLGLLPQMHRRERDVYANVKCLLEAEGRSVPAFENVPNRYLRPKSDGG
jgi:ankyrin repeat protein